MLGRYLYNNDNKIRLVIRKDKTMDINAKFKELAQYRMLEAEAKALKEAIEAELKEYMETESLEELIGDEHKVIYKEVIQNRFNSEAFRKDHADMYEAYKRPSKSRPFKFA